MAREQSYDVSGERSLSDKATALKNLAKSFDMKMRGFKMDTANDKWVPAGKALCTSTLITQAGGMIGTFAEHANLITTKRAEKFMMEFSDAFFKTNAAILNDMGTPAENHKAVIKIFKDTMSNIGDIITGSRSFIEKAMASDQNNPDNGEAY